jgi:hypothetical protein
VAVVDKVATSTEGMAQPAEMVSTVKRASLVERLPVEPAVLERTQV